MVTSSKARYRAFLSTEYNGRKMEVDEDLGAPRTYTQRKKYLKAYYAWLKPHRKSLVFVFSLAVVGMAFGMVLPLATKHVIDGVLLVNDVPTGDKFIQLHVICAVVVSLLLISEAFNVFRSVRVSVLNARVMFSLREMLFKRLINLPLGEISDMKTGGIVSRLSSDVDNVRGLIQMAIVSPGVAILQILFTLIVLFWMQWEMAIAASLFVPPLAIVSYYWVKRVRPVYRSMARDRTSVDSRVSETFGGIRVVRAFRREKREEFDYALGHHTIIRKNILATLNENIVGAGWGLIIPLAALMIIWFGGYLFLEGRASIGDIVAFQMYSAMILNPVWRIVNSISQTQRSLASMERVFEILERKTDKPDRVNAIPAPSTVKSINIQGVSFAYKTGTPVLHNIDLNIPGGAKVAFVGASGAGKTTITDLIARFYDPTEGTIQLNHIDLRDYQLASYRELLGVVQQDVFLFDGTVKENLAYGNPRAKLADIKEAACRAYANEFIDQFENGYETLIGERGVKLSGGQRQRLSIARAILANPQILILDEATSSLDTESEQMIQKALQELFRNRTTFVIAHRLSTITHADIIVVLEKGRIIEVGSHSVLMEAQKQYFAMVERQRLAFHI